MLESHLHEVVEIERASFRSPWPEQAFASDLDPGHTPWARSRILVDPARPASGVRGYICYWILEREMNIHNVAIHPSDRRRGGATFLLNQAFEDARTERCRTAWLEVRPSNAAALELYRKFGFAEVSRRRRYYQDTGEDAVVMRADLAGRSDPSGTPGREPGS